MAPSFEKISVRIDTKHF